MSRSVVELLNLRSAGLIQPDTDSDWTDDESAAIKAAYRAGQFVAAIRDLFPAEADEVEEYG